MAKILYISIIGFIVFEFIVMQILSYLNFRNWDTPLPDNVKNLMDKESVEKAKAYYRDKYKIDILSSSVSLCISLALLLGGGFAWLDTIIRTYTENPIAMSLLFFGVIMLASYLIGLPFSIYNTFVIEERYGFNKSTATLFAMDGIKGIVLGAIIGGVLLSIIVWLQEKSGTYFWIVAWATLSGFSIFMAMFYTSLLLPLFNKLSPMEEGTLKTKILEYVSKVQFPVNQIQIMDGSKRSSKANAFFSGLGPKKSIVLFDTLIHDMDENEIIAVLAHEVGHYKHKHIYKSIIISLISTGITLFIFGKLMHSDLLAEVLHTPKSFHIALLVFGMLYSPISMISAPLMNYFSRKNEFEADAYAKETWGASGLISGLKKLNINHLSQLNPHPLYVFFHYSHPPLSERIAAFEEK